MRTTRFLFTIVICGALLHEKSFADSSKRGPEQRSPDGREKAIGDSAGGGQRGGARASDKNGKNTHAGAIKPAPRPSLNNQNRSAQKLANGSGTRIPSGTSVNDHQFTAVKPAGAAKRELVGNKFASNHSGTARPQGAVPLAGSSFNAIHHQGSEPAALGGPMISGARSTAALNGTGFRKRGD